MRKQLLVIALMTISFFKSYSQINFEKGYFIDESNNKIDCLIKNIDWQSNPTVFEFRLSQNDEVQEATIQTVREFGIKDVSKYIRAKTDIDRSSKQIDKMSSERNPNFREELLFLKVLIEGEASLYHYVDENLVRLFYTLGDSVNKQLVYKKYLVEGKISENSYFKQQLSQQLKCEVLELNDIVGLRYTKRDIKKVFVKYNKCVGADYVDYEPKEKRDLFNFTFRTGLNYSSLEIQNSLSASNDTDFGGKIGFRFGIEAEFVLPYNKNKWGIIVEPTYRYYKSEQSKETSSVLGGFLVSKIDYRSIELPVGVRHYFYLNDQSKLFANISYVFDLSSGSTIDFLRIDDSILYELEITTRRNLDLGVGYKYGNRYSVEIRYNTNREILSDYLYWKANFSSVNLNFGWSIF